MKQLIIISQLISYRVLLPFVKKSDTKAGKTSLR